MVFADSGRCNRSSEDKRDQDAVADAPKLTLPLTAGQKVVTRHGKVGVVTTERVPSSGGNEVVHIYYPADEEKWWHHADSGLYDGEQADPDYEWHLVCDAPVAKNAALTLPLTMGQKVILRSGQKATVEDDCYCGQKGRVLMRVTSEGKYAVGASFWAHNTSGHDNGTSGEAGVKSDYHAVADDGPVEEEEKRVLIDWSAPIFFVANDEKAQFYGGAPTIVGIRTLKGTWTSRHGKERRGMEGMYDLSCKTEGGHCNPHYQIAVDEYGCAMADPSVQVVRN